METSIDIDKSIDIEISTDIDRIVRWPKGTKISDFIFLYAEKIKSEIFVPFGHRSIDKYKYINKYRYINRY